MNMNVAEQAEKNTTLVALEAAAKNNPEAGDLFEYRSNFNKLSKIIDGTNKTDKINDVLTPEFQRTLLKVENKDGIVYLKNMMPEALKNNPDNKELKDFANFLASTDGGNTQLEEENKNQTLGLAEEAPKWKINNIINFVESNDALISEYNIVGIADGHKFIDGGDDAKAIRNQCTNLIRDLGKRMILPTMYQADYLSSLATKNPNEVLSLTRALLLLSQLPKETLDKIGGKLTRDVHTETVKSGEYRTGALNAYTSNGTCDMTETNNFDKIPMRETQLTANPEVSFEKTKSEWQNEFKNILPRIDFIVQIPNPKNAKEVWKFQKQVNTDGTSKTGWYPITPFTYERAVSHINVVDLGNQANNRPTWLNTIRNDITGQGKYEAVLDVLNKEEGKNKQVRIDAAKQYLTGIAENPNPKLSAFVQKVETSLGKGGFKTFMNETYTLGL